MKKNEGHVRILLKGFSPLLKHSRQAKESENGLQERSEKVIGFL
jgi:hypothetical protein